MYYISNIQKILCGPHALQQNNSGSKSKKVWYHWLRGNFDCDHPSIHWSMGSAPVGVQCPITSSLGEFLGYWAGSGILD